MAYGQAMLFLIGLVWLMQLKKSDKIFIFPILVFIGHKLTKILVLRECLWITIFVSVLPKRSWFAILKYVTTLAIFMLVI